MGFLPSYSSYMSHTFLDLAVLMAHWFCLTVLKLRKWIKFNTGKSNPVVSVKLCLLIPLHSTDEFGTQFVFRHVLHSSKWIIGVNAVQHSSTMLEVLEITLKGWAYLPYT